MENPSARTIRKQQTLSGRDETPEDWQPTGCWSGQWLKARKVVTVVAEQAKKSENQVRRKSSR
jgi:hypothetical protein